jgi:superoxide dismutase, Fe-Mn family
MMKYDVQGHLKPRGLTGTSDGQIEQHWHLYEAYVKNTNELLEGIEAAKHGSRVWGGLKRRLGFEFNGMVLHEYTSPTWWPAPR